MLSPRKLASLGVCFAFVHPSLRPDTGPFDSQRGFRSSDQQVLVMLLLTGFPLPEWKVRTWELFGSLSEVSPEPAGRRDT